MKVQLFILSSLVAVLVLIVSGGVFPSGAQSRQVDSVAPTIKPLRVRNNTEPTELGGLSSPSALQTAGATARVSVASNMTQGNDESDDPAISDDGRYVAFASAASNLVSGDTNGVDDVFVHDRRTGITTRVSVASDGTQGNHASDEPAISADGRYVAFHSYASNLVSGDANTSWDLDVFVHDRQTGQTTIVSVASDGTYGNYNSYYPAISADGRYVAFESYADNLVDNDTKSYLLKDVFIHDRQTGQTTLISVAPDGTTAGNGDSGDISISDDGRYVAFDSTADNLVSGDTNGETDVFVRDRQTGQTTRVSVADDGTQGNERSWFSSISADGRYIAFASGADNLSGGDTNNQWDVFVRDRQTGHTTLVSVAIDGKPGNDSSGHWATPRISADGRYVAFVSMANLLVSGDTNDTKDMFVRDRQAGTTTRISVASDGTQGNDISGYGSISADGRYVAFSSSASNLVGGDTNNAGDIFVHDREVGSLVEITPGAGGTLTYTNTQGNKTTVAIPPGAVSQPISLTYASLSTWRSFSLEAYVDGVIQQNFVFSTPITITIQYSDTDVTGLDEDSLTLDYWDKTTSQWVDATTTCNPASAYDRHPAENWLAVPICHLSEFTLFAQGKNLVYLPLILRNFAPLGSVKE